MSALSDLSQVINPAVFEQLLTHRDRFVSAAPFPHVVMDDFLSPSFCAEICNQFPEFDVRGAINENGEIGGKSTQERVRALGPAFCRLDDALQSAGFLSLLTDITGVAELRYDPHYFGGGAHDNRHGQELDPHIDFNYHPLTRQHRRLNLIIYLNDTWQDAWGGSLQLHRDPYLEPRQDHVVTVTPLRNRCVVFATSEYSWHGFERIQLPAEQQHRSRKSFAVYFYTDTRPAKETVDEHSTIYVDRHLPEWFRTGRTLSADDVQHVQRLLARRDQHLKRLYRNVQRLLGEVNRLKVRDIPPTAAVMVLMDKLSESGATTDWIVRHLMARIHELEQSTSWRITAPLRALKHLLARRR